MAPTKKIPLHGSERQRVAGFRFTGTTDRSRQRTVGIHALASEVPMARSC